MSVKFSGTAVAVVALFAAGSVQAADLIVDVPAVEAAVAGVDWTGAYIGGHIGAVWGDVNSFDPDEEEESEFDISGGVAGVQAGYNWQSDNLVYGIEGDLSFARVSGEQGVDRLDINWTASLRGRLGFGVESLLFYGTAGIAAANTTGHFLAFPAEDTQTHVGWTVGLGLEAMLTDDISAKLEYSYADYGTANYHYPRGNGGPQRDFSLTTHAIKAGINFHL